MVSEVIVVGKPGCHLCAKAHAVVAAECAAAGVAWRQVSILDEPALADAYWEVIPVVLIDGAVHDQLRIDPLRLRRALAG